MGRSDPNPNPHLFGDRAPASPRCTKGFNLGFGPWARPSFLPFARALRMPALTRSTIKLRSRSATAGPKREHCHIAWVNRLDRKTSQQQNATPAQLDEEGEQEVSPKALENNGGPGQSRTADLRFRKPLLYPSELRGQCDVTSFSHTVYGLWRRTSVRFCCPIAVPRGLSSGFCIDIFFDFCVAPRTSVSVVLIQHDWVTLSWLWRSIRWRDVHESCLKS